MDQEKLERLTTRVQKIHETVIRTDAAVQILKKDRDERQKWLRSIIVAFLGVAVVVASGIGSTIWWAASNSLQIEANKAAITSIVQRNRP